MSSPSDHWPAVRALFDAAMAQPRADRRAYVEQAQAAAQVRSDVLSLLDHADERTPDMLAASAPAAQWLLGELGHPSQHPSQHPPAPADVDALASGTRLGPWRIVREVGRGGMGRVYEAERADGSFDGRAAIKLLRRADAGVLRRFALERQALARLNHPNIARLLDAGTDAHGLAYFVMEWVDGQPIDLACALLDIDARLRLFLQLADAVAYAHQNLLLHRDLKPGNVLVNGAGQVKLLDFGIAKLLDASGAELGDITHEHEGALLRPFTPNYASPEQVRGEPLTTATDVYSLGVLLCQLLSGHRPYGRSATTPQQAIDAVLDEPPSRPSRLAATTPATPAANASEAAAGRIARRLRGDLDNIVLKALDKEPQRRYASVAALADDVRRHLAGLPITARPPRMAYVVGKFLRRHRLASGALALGLAGVLLGAGVAAQQALRADQARRLAEQRLAEVRQLSNALVFKYHDQIRTLAGSTAVRAALLNDALGHLDTMAREAEDDPKLARELAETYNRIAALQGDTFSPSTEQLDLAEQSLAKARALLPRFASARSADAAALRSAADIYTGCGVLALRRARQQDALDCQLQALALLERARAQGGDSADLLAAVATAQGRIGMIYGHSQFGASLGQWRRALPHLRAALQGMQTLAEREPGNPERLHQLAWAWQLLASWHGLQAEADAALNAASQAVALREQASARAPDNLQYRHQLSSARLIKGVALASSGRADEAIALQTPELARMEDNMRADPANRAARRDRAVAGISLARSLLAAERCAQVRPQLRESIAMLEAGPSDPRDYYVNRLLAEAHLRLAQCERAADAPRAYAALEQAAARLDPEGTAAASNLVPASRLALAQALSMKAAWKLDDGDLQAARSAHERAGALWAAEQQQGPIAGLYRNAHAQWLATGARLAGR